MSAPLTAANSSIGGSTQRATLERQRTVRFSDDTSAPIPMKQSHILRSRPDASAAADAATAITASRPLAMSTAGAHVPAISTVLRSQAPPAVDASIPGSTQLQPSGVSLRGLHGPSSSAYAGVQELRQGPNGGGAPPGAPARGPPQPQSMEGAEQQQQQQQQARGRRVLEIEGTPSSLRRIADTTKPDLWKMNKIANVAFIPSSRSRSGSCPVFSRLCPRSGKQQFTLFGNIAGCAGPPQQPQQRKGGRKQQQKPLFATMCCFAPSGSSTISNSNKGSVQGVPTDYYELQQEILKLREQNAALIKERDELLVSCSRGSPAVNDVEFVAT